MPTVMLVTAYSGGKHGGVSVRDWRVRKILVPSKGGSQPSLENGAKRIGPAYRLDLTKFDASIAAKSIFPSPDMTFAG